MRNYLWGRKATSIPVMGALVLTLAVLLFTGCGSDPASPEPPATGGPPGLLYVANQTDSTIYVYNTENMQRVDSFPAGLNLPHSLKFSSDYKYLYVVSKNFPGRVAKFNAVTNTYLGTCDLPGVYPTAIAITPDGQFGYVGDYSPPSGGLPNKAFKLNLGTMTIVDSVSAGGAYTHDMAVTSDGKVVLATNMTDVIGMIYTDADTMHVVNIDPDSVYAIDRRKYGCYGIAIDKHDSLAYIACLHHHEAPAQVRVLDIATQSIVDSIYLPINFDHPADPAGATQLELSPDDAYLYITTQGDNSIIILRLATRTVIEYPTEVWNTFGVTRSADGSRVYVAAANLPLANGRVYVLNGNTFDLIDSVDVGRNSFGLRWRPR